MPARRTVLGAISIFGTTAGRGRSGGGDARDGFLRADDRERTDRTDGRSAPRNHAYVQAELATARTTAAAAMRDAVTPGQEASLLLHQASALIGKRRHCRSGSTRGKGSRCILRPADPCVMLGDALFHLGMVRGTAKDIRQLWEEAAQKDEACGLSIAAATKLMNLAQYLRQPQIDGSAAGSAEEAEELYESSRKIALGRPRLSSRSWPEATWRSAAGRRCFAKDSPLVDIGSLRRRGFSGPVGRTADLAFTLAEQGLVFFQAGG